MTSRPVLYSILCLAIGVFSPHGLLAQESISEEESAAAEHMHERLTAITTIKAFITMGRLEGIREPANWLATHEKLPEIPERYEPFDAFMRSSARQIEKAEDLKTAANAVSLMAQNCGNCHRASHVSIEFGYDEHPPEWSDLETHMQRYQWSMARLWEGLIGPSDSAWSRGTSMLAAEPLSEGELSDVGTAENAARIASIAREVHQLGRASTGLTSPNDRSRVYGRILGLCADCHTRVGRGPGM